MEELTPYRPSRPCQLHHMRLAILNATFYAEFDLIGEYMDLVFLQVSKQILAEFYRQQIFLKHPHWIGFEFLF
jgi:hypothetical protein